MLIMISASSSSVSEGTLLYNYTTPVN